MKIKTFLICWLPAFIMVFGLNGFFHARFAADFFNSNLAQLAPAIRKMQETKPIWVAMLDLILTFGMTYFITVRQTTKINLAEAALAGALINLISSGAWNFANEAMFQWSTIVTLGDIFWHICLGTLGGLLIAILYNKVNRHVKANV